MSSYTKITGINQYFTLPDKPAITVHLKVLTSQHLLYPQPFSSLQKELTFKMQTLQQPLYITLRISIRIVHVVCKAFHNLTPACVFKCIPCFSLFCSLRSSHWTFLSFTQMTAHLRNSGFSMSVASEWYNPPFTPCIKIMSTLHSKFS